MRYTNFSQAVALTSGVLAVCFLMGYIVLAWTEPTQAPPGGNVPTPLNTGNVGQSKEGGLILNTGGAAMGLIVQSGKVGIGLSDVGIYKMGVGGHLYVGGNVAINGGDLNVAGDVKGNRLCIGDDCRTSWPVSTAPNLQCPPKRVMVDETSANWDEWASYDTCSPTSNYVEFYGTRIYDNGTGLYLKYCDSDFQYCQDVAGCQPYCQEFGFSTGQTINSERVQYSYGNHTGRWEKGYVQFPIGQGASKSCRCYP